MEPPHARMTQSTARFHQLHSASHLHVPQRHHRHPVGGTPPPAALMIRRSSSRSHCHPCFPNRLLPRSLALPPLRKKSLVLRPCQSTATPGQFSMWQLLIVELLMVTTLPSQESRGPSKILACSPLASRPLSRICLLGFGRPPPSHPPAAAVCVCTESRCPAELPRAPPPGVLRPAASSCSTSPGDQDLVN
jgi:hypothetical protein